jgi:hypothetical protein
MRILKNKKKTSDEADLNFSSKLKNNPKPAKSKTDAINPNPIKNSI